MSSSGLESFKSPTLRVMYKVCSSIAKAGEYSCSVVLTLGPRFTGVILTGCALAYFAKSIFSSASLAILAYLSSVELTLRKDFKKNRQNLNYPVQNKYRLIHIMQIHGQT